MLNVKFPDGKSKAVLIGYSGGKDSLAVIDLAVHAGLEVTCFYMYFLPGMEISDKICSYAENRWGIRVLQYQHWNISYYLRRAVFRSTAINVPTLSITDIECAVRQDTGLDWVLYGFKSIDSLQRRGMMNRWKNNCDFKRCICAPIKDWNNTDVLAYLNRKRIMTPVSSFERRSSGIGLTPLCMEWLRDKFPNDYNLVLKTFPHAIAQASRAQFIRQWKADQHKRKCKRNVITC